ncbi:MAG TPA: heme o synthase [Polyangiaceae bacterium]
MPSASQTLAVSRRATLGALVELTKPSIAALVMVTALCGALVAPGPLPVARLLIALVATALVVGAANALNMYVERDADALMRRTRNRPLPSGRLSPEIALGFALVLASVGLNTLGVVVGGVAFFLTFLAFTSYVLAYTPLKRLSQAALYVGALPGALPPLIGFASVTGGFGEGAAWLFLVLFVWQIPHFLAIAIFRSEDYRAAGMKVHSVVHGVRSTKIAIVLSSLVLAAVTLAPAWTGAVRTSYLLVAAPSAFAFTAYAVLGLRTEAHARWARRLFFLSMPYLVVVYAAFVARAA